MDYSYNLMKMCIIITVYSAREDWNIFSNQSLKHMCDYGYAFCEDICVSTFSMETPVLGLVEVSQHGKVFRTDRFIVFW